MPEYHRSPVGPSSWPILVDLAADTSLQHDCGTRTPTDPAQQHHATDQPHGSSINDSKSAVTVVVPVAVVRFAAPAVLTAVPAVGGGRVGVGVGVGSEVICGVVVGGHIAVVVGGGTVTADVAGSDVVGN
jgi:hypothetical protein